MGLGEKSWSLSGIWKKFIPDPGGKKALGPGSGSATLPEILSNMEIVKFWSLILN
jgi:hypothetical protein